MAGLPHFPIAGSVLSNNVSEDRFSLLVNPVGNVLFPAGQYVFYTKNKSLWYKYKTPTQTWSSETLFISGGFSSNTKFDLNGYPVTGYLLPDSSINLQNYVNGVVNTTTIAASGSLPTVVINADDTFLFFIPPSYVDTFNYVQGCDSFSIIKNYKAIIPGTVTSMQIQLVDKGKFLFSFECDTINSKKVYIAFSNPNFQFITKDLPAFITFMQGNFVDEYFVIAEKAESNVLALGTYSQISNEEFNISELFETANLILVSTGTNGISDYFIVSQVSDLRAIADVVASVKIRDEFLTISDDLKPDFKLNFIPANHPVFGDYFVVSESSDVFTEKLTVTKKDLGIESLGLKDLNIFYSSKKESTTAPVLNEKLYIFDDNDRGPLPDGRGPRYVFTAVSPNVQRRNEYFVIEELVHIQTDKFIKTIDSVDGLLGPDKFYINDFEFPSFENIRTIFISENTKLESFSINDSSFFNLYMDPYYASKELLEITEPKIDLLSSEEKLADSVIEKLQIHEILSIVFSTQADFNFNIATDFYLGFLNEIHIKTTVAEPPVNLREEFGIVEGIQSVSGLSSISLKILKDIAPYTFYTTYNVTEELSATTFLSNNSAIPSFYYYSSVRTKAQIGPHEYDVVISPPQVTFSLTHI